MTINRKIFDIIIRTIPIREGEYMGIPKRKLFSTERNIPKQYASFLILTLFIFHTTLVHGFNKQYSPSKIRKIEFCAEGLFGGNQPLPGFSHFSYDKRNKNKIIGNTFELEAALYLQQKKCEPILGFGLVIQFVDDGVFVVINEQIEELTTTEFDVISEHYVVECKSSVHPGRKTNLQQLEKEQKMLLWTRSLLEDLQHGNLSISHESGRITLNGPSTYNMDINLYCNWMDELPIENPIDRFIYIIGILAAKELRVFFKNTVSPEFAGRLAQNRFFYEDNIQIVRSKYNKFADFEALFDQETAEDDISSISPQRSSTPTPNYYETSYYAMA